MAPTLREVWRRFKVSVSGSGRQDFLEEAADMDSDRLLNYSRAERYYQGDHRVQLTTREKEYLQASGIPYAENFCETIVDTKAEGLYLRGFDAEGEVADFLRDLAEQNRLDTLQKRIHKGAVKLGDYFVIVEPGRELPDGTFSLPAICPNHPKHVKIVYDSDEPLYAAKIWNTRRASVSNPGGEAIVRLNIYWPDSIEKFFATSSTDRVWAPFREAEEDEGTTVFWTMDGTPDGEPIGIPAAHFANKPDPYYGISKLRGVIPQQDALNKTLIDHFWVMDAQGWPQQYATGAAPTAVVRHPGSLWTIESENAKVGQLQPADPEKSIAAIESQVKRMSSRSKTPLHLMLAGGNLPSGETLKTSESGYVREGQDFQRDAGSKWTDIAHMAARLVNAFDPDRNLPDDAPITPMWEGIETRNEVDEANVAVLKQTIGVSTDTLLAELGYDPEKERENREADVPAVTNELLKRANDMRAPTRSEENGGGQQPAQRPVNRRAGV